MLGIRLGEMVRSIGIQRIEVVIRIGRTQRRLQAAEAQEQLSMR